MTEAASDEDRRRLAQARDAAQRRAADEVTANPDAMTPLFAISGSGIRLPESAQGSE